MAIPSEINVGLLGLGVVGGGVASVLQRRDAVSRAVGHPVRLKSALVRDLAKQRDMDLGPASVTDDPQQVLADPEVHVVAEVMGGVEPALGFLKQALSSGKHVVTANKEVMAKHGLELLDLARQNRVSLLFEASVGGGIPIVGCLLDQLAANDVRSIRSIINGTTNYILSQMANEGTAFPDALRQAQQLGYAEADPTNDVEGYDAAYKIGILASIAFRRPVGPEDVYRQGISGLEPQDFLYAEELGYAIKPLAIAALEDGAVCARVYPALVPFGHMLAKVDGAYNAVEVEGSLCGKVLLHGMGAGREPTASAVIGNIIEIGRSMVSSCSMGSLDNPMAPSASWSQGDSPDAPVPVRPIDDLVSSYYLRINVADQPGVLAHIAHILGQGQISIASVLQKGADQAAQTAELVIITHPSREADVQEALLKIADLTVVKLVNNLLRIEG